MIQIWSKSGQNWSKMSQNWSKSEPKVNQKWTKMIQISEPIWFFVRAGVMCKVNQKWTKIIYNVKQKDSRDPKWSKFGQKWVKTGLKVNQKWTKMIQISEPIWFSVRAGVMY